VVAATALLTLAASAFDVLEGSTWRRTEEKKYLYTQYEFYPEGKMRVVYILKEDGSPIDQAKGTYTIDGNKVEFLLGEWKYSCSIKDRSMHCTVPDPKDAAKVSSFDAERFK